MHLLKKFSAVKSFQHFQKFQVFNIFKCLILEIKCNGKSVILTTLYRTSSQSTDEFNNFLSKFEDNSFLIISKKNFLTYILVDYNAMSSQWCLNNKSSPENLQIESLTSYYGLTQVINETTHLLSNSLSCIDLIFTTQLNLVTHSGVHSSFHKKLSPSNQVCKI